MKGPKALFVKLLTQSKSRWNNKKWVSIIILLLILEKINMVFNRVYLKGLF